jgi:hypothetical protein
MTGFDRVLFRKVSSTRNAALLAFLLCGIFFWGTGGLVKIYFMCLGRSTYPWRAFLSPEALVAEFCIGGLLSLPHFALIVLGRRYVENGHSKRTTAQKESEVVWALRGGCLAIIMAGVGVFWEFDPIVFLGLPYFWGVIGLFAGAGALAARRLSPSERTR